MSNTDPNANNYNQNHTDDEVVSILLSYSIYVNQTTSNTNCDGWATVTMVNTSYHQLHSWYDNNNNLLSINNNISSICIGNYSVSVTDAVFGCIVDTKL